jgi:ABC-type glycerol-3-phosphate transport system permease component
VSSVTRQPGPGHLRASRITAKTLTYVALIVGAVILMMPFVFMVSTAFIPNALALSVPPTLIPTNPTLENFVQAWNGTLVISFSQALANSVVVSVASTALCVLLSAMLAFAFARYSFPGKTLFYYFIILTFMLPAMALIIPQFVLAENLHLINSLQGLVVIYTANMALNIFLLRGFFEDIPRDLQDAADIDGAGILRMFWSIMLPLARPALATVTILTFLGNWNEYTYALTFLNDPGKFTLPVAISYFQGENLTDYSVLFAASLIATIPVIAVFLVLQRHFVKGISAGAVKA